MARARNIKPGFYANEDLAECDVWARFIFPGLWMLADREGRLEDRPKRIKGELLPYDSVEVEPLLEELQRRGFIARYTVGDLALIQVLKFARHQNPHHREHPSKYPPPLGWVAPALQPEASEPCQVVKAQGEPEASPGLSTQETTSQGVKAGLIPDPGSRIPDPGSLIPDTGFIVTGAADPVEERPAARTIPRAKRKGAENPCALTIDGVPEDLLRDYLAVRAAKGAKHFTETALAGLRRESTAAGISLAAAIQTCVEASWIGFRADWYAARASRQGTPAPMSTELRNAEAKRLLGFGRQPPVDDLIADVRHRLGIAPSAEDT